MGSARHKEDEDLLSGLQQEVLSLQIEDNVRFIANGPYSQLQEYMSHSFMGIHTMWNEHFGISIVEMMAAGLVVVAHNSGGPKLDIIPQQGSDALGKCTASC